MSGFEDRIQTLVDWMSGADRVVVFTGAGISTDSGLPDFRGPDGVWTRRDKGLPPPDTKRDWTDSMPNAAHHSIVDLQRLGKLDFVVSQNVDNLHLTSGIEPANLAELHGNLARVRCERCETTFSRDEDRQRCTCGGGLKSSVVGFGDALPAADLQASFEHAAACDLMIVLGSSLVVTPAADVPLAAVQAGARLVIVNQGDTPLDPLADLRFEERIADVFPPAVAALEARA